MSLTEKNNMKKKSAPPIQLGDMFGRWMVVGPAVLNKKGFPYHECECSCTSHTARRVKVYDLQDGRSTSCGCIAKEKAKARGVQVEPGTMFGRWTVLEEGPRNKHGQRTALCRCSCENKTERLVDLYCLRAGKSTGCECVNREAVRAKALAAAPVYGTVFGRWSVVKTAGQTKRGTAQSLCECSCEAKTRRVVSVASLKRGLSTSCGCYAKEVSTTHGMSGTKEYYTAYQQENKEAIAKRKRAHRQEHPEQVRLEAATRRARKLRATPNWDQEKTKEVFLNLSKQAQTLQDATGVAYHVDHIVPFVGKIDGVHVVSGLHTADNLQLLPYFDNLQKSNAVWPSMP